MRPEELRLAKKLNTGGGGLSGPRARRPLTYSGSTRKRKNSPFCTLMDICHVKHADLEPKYQKYDGRVVLLGDIVRDDSGSCAAFTEQGSFAPQCRKCCGCHCKTTRLCRTGSRRSISLHSSKNERRSKITANSKVRMSRYLDTCSTTTQVANILVKH